MNIEELENLVRIVNRSQVHELVLRHGAAKIRIRKNSDDLSGLDAEETEPARADEARGDRESTGQPADRWIRAALVGVFHHARPAIGLGTPVAAGQVVGMIESMKLANDVVAPAAGLISDVQAEEGMPVEFHQPLFEISPEGA